MKKRNYPQFLTPIQHDTPINQTQTQVRKQSLSKRCIYTYTTQREIKVFNKAGGHELIKMKVREKRMREETMLTVTNLGYQVRLSETK